MKTIIAATDFSPAATNAVNYAADMAMAIHADLLLFYSYEFPIGFMEVPVAIDVNALQRTAEAEINKCREKIIERTTSKLSVSTEVHTGMFFQELKSVCESVHPYAVVMGSQGTTAAQRFLFGSHTVHAMKQLEWPLITVPPEASFNSIRKIGFACDFEKLTSTIPVDAIKTLVSDFNAELHVINTTRIDQYNPDIVFGSSMLKSMLDPINPQLHYIYNENTDEAIMDFAEKNDIDILMLLPKRHGLMEKLLHKSHTKQMILHSHVPVLTFHPDVN